MRFSFINCREFCAPFTFHFVLGRFNSTFPVTLILNFNCNHKKITFLSSDEILFVVIKISNWTIFIGLPQIFYFIVLQYDKKMGTTRKAKWNQTMKRWNDKKTDDVNSNWDVKFPGTRISSAGCVRSFEELRIQPFNGPKLTNLTISLCPRREISKHHEAAPKWYSVLVNFI